MKSEDPFTLTSDILVMASSIGGSTEYEMKETIKSRKLGEYIDLLKRVCMLEQKGDRYFTAEGGVKYILAFNNRDASLSTGKNTK
ncbi:MAG: hypothetical protein V1678_04865 [Candidatus Aenigmatarchaeota archaeon]